MRAFAADGEGYVVVALPVVKLDSVALPYDDHRTGVHVAHPHALLTADDWQRVRDAWREPAGAP